ncbi:hypothetical protein [Streptacidiphilus sp. ASG 303]|uniref:hypothetical protein n=1 Tax=Streptomycetaceae TaxID=2062 RepID=UPI001E5614B9|nr:hypothetical protein [Streptacidiphilus sp. ASG 303]MCD0486162.1 hypothetical protein [Streptacidiphilus sp. ASG 303]
MRNRRLAAVLAGALLAGSLTAGAGVALATADRDAAPAAAQAAPRADASRTVDLLGSLGEVTSRVNDLVSSAKRGGAVAQAQQNAGALGDAAQQLSAKVGRQAGQGVPARGKGGARAAAALPSVDDVIGKLKGHVQDLLTALQKNDQKAVSDAIQQIADDAVALVKAVLAALGVALPALPAAAS